MVGNRIRGALEEAQAAEQDARAVRKSRLVHLRAEVVLVEDEPLAEGLERQSECPEGVRRVACLDDVEALGAVRAQHERSGSQPAVRELVQVRRDAPRVGRGRVAPDQDSVEDLLRLVARRHRAHDRDLEPRIAERARLQPDPPVEWDRQVLHDDEDAPSVHVVRLHHAIPE